MGSAAGMTLLFDGSYEMLEAVISNMTGEHIGMVCDGAGDGCVLENRHAVDAAYRAVFLARKGIRVGGAEGLVSNAADESIRNIGLSRLRVCKLPTRSPPYYDDEKSFLKTVYTKIPNN